MTVVNLFTRDEHNPSDPITEDENHKIAHDDTRGLFEYILGNLDPNAVAAMVIVVNRNNTSDTYRSSYAYIHAPTFLSAMAVNTYRLAAYQADNAETVPIAIDEAD